MDPVKKFQDLIVWKKAHQYVLKVYEYTSALPKHEMFGLSSQFRRAATSVAANVVEGFRKVGNKDKLRFFNIAQGSVEECRYYQILSNDLSYGPTNHLAEILEDASRLLNGYCKGIIEKSNIDYGKN